jgi:hypothetical protein
MINTKRNSFTKEEDGIIIRFVKEHEPQNWNDITSIIKTKTCAKCRERWKNILILQIQKKILAKKKMNS